MDFILQNWEWFLLATFIADNIVKITPTKWDDLIVTAIKGALFKFTKKKKDLE